MANPNKSARGSGWSPKAAANRQRRFEESPMAADMAKFQSGEMSAEDFRRKYDPNFGDGQ